MISSLHEVKSINSNNTDAETGSETTTTVSTNFQSTSTTFTLNPETTSLPESVIIAAVISASVLILAIFTVTSVCCLLYSKNRKLLNQHMNESQENNVSESHSHQITSNPAYSVHDGTHLMNNNPAYNTLDSQLMNNPAYNLDLSGNQTEPYYSIIAT